MRDPRPEPMPSVARSAPKSTVKTYAPATGPENLADVLGRLFVARGWGRKSERVRLETAWAEVVPPEQLADTRVSVLRRGVLEVEVRSGVLMQELAMFQKRGLLAAIRKKLPSTVVTDLKFRVGVW